MADQRTSPHADVGEEEMSHPTAEANASEETTTPDDWFWDHRPALRHIRDAAHSRGVSAPAVLAVVLARVVAEVDPRVTLPPLIGSETSLNTYVALLGPSGSGKTSVMAVVEDLYPWTVDQRSVGSGEGLLRGYGHISKKEEWVQTRSKQFLYVDEIVTLSAQASRAGSTILGLLNTAWTGQALSQLYADPTKNAQIPRHGYRLCLVIGVQLGKADNLLSHSDAGTPQRFCWAPMIDSSIPPPGLAPVWPGELDWAPVDVHDGDGTIQLQIPDEVAFTMRERFQERATSWEYSGGDRDHDDLLRLKIAASLALLDSRWVVSSGDWDIAGVLMRLSRKSLEMVRADRRERDRRRALWRGEQAFAASRAEQSFREQGAIERTARRIANHVRQHARVKPHGCVKKCAKNGLSQDGLMEHFDAAVDFGSEQGWIVVQTDTKARRLIPGDRSPKTG